MTSLEIVTPTLLNSQNSELKSHSSMDKYLFLMNDLISCSKVNYSIFIPDKMSFEKSEILTNTAACEHSWMEKKRNQEADGNCFYDVAAG